MTNSSAGPRSWLLPRHALPILAASLTLSACASSPNERATTQRFLDFDNSSGNVVHVYLRVGGNYMRLSAVEPMSRTRLRVPDVTPSSSAIVVVPAGELARFRVSGGSEGIHVSELLNFDEMLSLRWRFSGRFVIAAGTAWRRP